ncbi:uncharacterized protein LOC134243689 [Saccostrea cucullata]|uniref:uncharacterized protein LOC134243689 n=1 Tax=Saccostrea cuccullata TaxID=36930 RepID=UPI002ED3CF4C
METSTASSDVHYSEEVLLGESSTSEQLSNEDAVSLFNSSLRKALQQQNEVIVSSIVKQINSKPNNPATNTGHEDSAREDTKHNSFDFKHEGHRIQHTFNTERIEKLIETKNFIEKKDLENAALTIEKEIGELRQRNKILKIADRHGWDTVNEYLDDPLADNNDDAVKLRGAVSRAVRKRNYRGKPYTYPMQNRRQNAFAANDFFRTFGQTFATGGYKQFAKPIEYGAGQQNFERKCFFCRQVGHYVRDCPFARGQQVPVSASTVASASSNNANKQ